MIKNIPNVPTKDGYDGAWESYTINAGDITVNAVYTAKQYTITYSGTKGVTNSNKTSYTPDTETFSLSDLSKEGYTFDGWYNGTTKVTKIEKGSYGNLNLEAKWTAIEYTATFKADGNTVGTATYTIEDNAIKNVPSVPTKGGYDGAWESYAIKAGDITVNAVYTAKQYTITWKDYDGSTLKISKCVHGQTPAYGTSPSRVGDYQYEYKFSGWSPAVTSAFEDATYTATYSQNKYSFYTIKYNMNGGNGTISSQTKKCGSEVILSSTIPTYEGHTFIGWNNIYENNIYQAGDSFNLDFNVTLWAMWEETCEHCDGTGVYPVPSRDDYDFIGWTDDNNDTIHSSWDYTEDKSFYAQWELHKFNINYVMNNGVNNDDNPSFYPVEDGIITLQDPTREGYTFEGWYLDSTCTNSITEIDPQNRKDYTIYAKWIANEFSISYYLNGGTNNPSNIYSIGRYEQFELLDPTREGYTFEGWYLESTFKTQIKVINGTNNVNYKIYAKWTPNQYNVIAN